MKLTEDSVENAESSQDVRRYGVSDDADFKSPYMRVSIYNFPRPNSVRKAQAIPFRASSKQWRRLQ